MDNAIESPSARARVNVKGKGKGKANIKLLKCGDTLRKAYNKVYHSVYALALQEGGTNARAKCRAKLAARAHVCIQVNVDSVWAWACTKLCVPTMIALIS